jgi:single-strand DNA-binding protein
MLNKAVLMGRLTRDPELKHTQSNKAVASFSLACERDRKNADGNYDTDFIDIVAWEQTAEFAVKYFRKGMLVAVVGRLQTRKWTDKEGKPRVAFEVVADEVHFAEKKQDAAPRTEAPRTSSPAPQYNAPVKVNDKEIPDMTQGFDDVTGDSEELPF